MNTEVDCQAKWASACSFLISQRPDVEAKITAELAAAGLLASPENPNPRKMELADLNRLPYFVNVCKVQSQLIATQYVQSLSMTIMSRFHS